MISSEYRKLYNEAKKISETAYAPYSKFCVGAALLTKKGSVYLGVNIENSSYGATICAERSAISAAVTAGEVGFDAIAICGNSGKAWPCGICRQVLLEFGEDIKIITGDDVDNLEVVVLSSLLPKGFKL